MATSLIPLKTATVWKDADMVPTSGDPITAEWITSVMGNLIMASLGLEKTAVAWGIKNVTTNNAIIVNIATDKSDGIDSFANTNYAVILTDNAYGTPLEVKMRCTSKAVDSFTIDNLGDLHQPNFDVHWFAIGERG